MKYTYFQPLPESVTEASKMWKRLAMQHHPDIDKNEGATARMQAVNAEYAALLSGMGYAAPMKL